MITIVNYDMWPNDEMKCETIMMKYYDMKILTSYYYYDRDWQYCGQRVLNMIFLWRADDEWIKRRPLKYVLLLLWWCDMCIVLTVILIIMKYWWLGEAIKYCIIVRNRRSNDIYDNDK